MKKFSFLILGMVAGFVLAVGLLWIGLNDSVLAKSGPASQSGAAAVTAVALLSDEGAAVGTRQVAGGDELPQAGLGSQPPEAPLALPTPIPGETLLYFVPTDNDATATVIYLYNTDSVDHTIALRGFSYNGALAYSLNIVVPALSFRRLASDSIAAAPPPSWATPAPIITNFTDFVYFASLSLPRGVKAEGYTLFNPGAAVVDPRSDQGAIPLRFSTDPATLFMPAVQNAP